MQALTDGQSELTKHSGRQLGTEPIIPATQPHWACPETTWHCELGPQGDGVHGLGGRGRNVPSSTTGLVSGATRSYNDHVRHSHALQFSSQKLEQSGYKDSCLLGITEQPVSGSPVQPDGHTQIGL